MNQLNLARNLLVALVLSIMSPAVLEAQQPGKLGQAARALVKWFNDLAGSIKDLGQGAERAYLIDRLIDLHRDLYLLEHDKSYLIQDALHRRTPNTHEIERVVGELESRVLAARTDLRAIGSRLSSQRAAQGFQAERLLREAMQERNAFLMRLRDALESGGKPQTFHGLAQEGEEALKELRNARWALTQLIQKMDDES